MKTVDLLDTADGTVVTLVDQATYFIPDTEDDTVLQYFSIGPEGSYRPVQDECKAKMILELSALIRQLMN